MQGIFRLIKEAESRRTVTGAHTVLLSCQQVPCTDFNVKTGPKAYVFPGLVEVRRVWGGGVVDK